MDAVADGASVLVPALLIVVGLLGIVIPVLPGLPVVVGGVLLWAVLEGSALGWGILVASVVVAVAGFALQYLVPGRRMREQGVSSSTLAIAVLIGIVGFFVIPVVGALVGFVLGIYVVELGRGRDRAQAWTRTKHGLVAVLHSIGIELGAGLVIAALFVAGVVAA
ncbi:DUF456 domain-containing protein [Fodinibacter luteus]|uniref:DUF456 domain-containing protein n=1 Tax=Fodinibacter luteus TaxID=552064 RepID=A0ABP8KFB0_9MICO